MHRLSRPALVAALGAVGLVVGIPPTLGSAAARDHQTLSARSIEQIAALAREKAARSPAERKIETSLLTAVQHERGRALPPGVRARSAVRVDVSGRTAVEVDGAVNGALVDRVRSFGGIVRSRTAGSIRVDLPLTSVQAVAALPQVTHLASFSAGFITAGPGRPAPPLTLAALRAGLKSESAAGLGQRRPPSDGTVSAAVGSVRSEGDVVHGVAAARARLNLSGVGISVGVLSDGVDSLAQSQSTGDLPAVTVLRGAAGFGDEGTAMLEIVHDLAPKAALLFASAIESEASMARNIRRLRAAGADVIVDDILYFGESPFQDGLIARAVAEVTRDGALYVSSAGNEGNLDDGTSGNYEATFTSSGTRVGGVSGVPHDFDPGPGIQSVDPVTSGSVGVPAILQWAEPLGAATDDYDLYALDPHGDVVGFSNDVQDGDDDPFEGFFLPDVEGLRLVVVKSTGAARYFQLSVLRGRFGPAPGLNGYATDGVTRGHSTVPAAYSVAAVPAADPLPFDLEAGDPPNPSGPYPDRYTTSQQSERFTSDGPRRIFFAADGRPLTPGDFTATGGRVRRKPDITAADGVSTSVAGFSPFFGTSAAAPHAAAIAALGLSGAPDARLPQIRAALTGTALDLEAPGWDRVTGAGVIAAVRVLRALGATGQPFVRLRQPVAVATSDGDALLEPGERGLLTLRAVNLGDVPATGVVATLRSTGGVRIRPAGRAYGTLQPGVGRERRFHLRLPGTLRAGDRVSFTARARFEGAFSPVLTTSTLPVGQPSRRVVTAAYDGPDVPIPDNDEAGVEVDLPPVTGVGRVSEVTFSVDGSRCAENDDTSVGLAHPFVSDLVGTLTSPDGTTATLFQRSGGDGRNLCQVRFADTAEVPFSEAASSQAPFTGSWRPDEPLSVFFGTQGDGVWSFAVADLAPVDTGAVRRVSVHVRGFVGGG